MQNKKGFTLVELLAVVVILGIIMMVSIPAVSKWITRSKGESKTAQEKTLLLAGQAYAQGNSKILPKAIGESKLIKAIDLKKANYLKDDLKDSNKNDCMKDSVVRIYKYDKNGYSYTAYLYCEGDVVPNVIEGVRPTISFEFKGDNLEEEIYQDVSKAGFRITIDGGKKDGKDLGIDGYTYSISVKYAGTGEIVEIFNSGSLNAGGKEKLVIEKSLSDYTNITTLSEFMVTAEAYNRDGGYAKETGNSKYGDSTGPKCGDIEGQAGVNEWFSSPKTSTISVKCIDEKNGSGCIKDVFTQSWNTEVEDDYITIENNAGNKTKCKVRVHHDWTAPTLTVTAHKRTEGGGAGAQTGSATANDANKTVTLNTYTGNHNGWLNYANYRYGVYYEIVVTDNIHVNRGQWYYNSSGIYNANSSNLNKMTAGASKVFTPEDNKTSVYLSSEGRRRGKYELTDMAGNKVTVNIVADMDRSAPYCSTSKSNTYTEEGVTVNMTCGDGESGVHCPCGFNETTATCVAESGVKASKFYSISDTAGNGGGCSVAVSVQVQTRTSSCNTYNSCANSACGQCTDYSNCTSSTYSCIDSAGDSWTGSSSQCIYGIPCSCSKSCNSYGTKNCTCRTSGCGCEVWNDWSGWSVVSSCTATTGNSSRRECRNLYY